MANILKNTKIAIIGIGYVGLPLLQSFAKKFSAIGFDINKKKINFLKKKYNNYNFTYNLDDLNASNFFIICVPTPLKKNNLPDLSILIKATEIVAKRISKNSYIVFESTVYPGVTEDICIPILERISNLKLNKDFFVGYSPERINPGDKINTLEKIKKIVSASNPKSLKYINQIYSSIIKSGTYMAPNIKIAEAAKVIENSQRDINIAFINELSIIFSNLDIDTYEVLKAAKTKWNFLNFKPGLVGGHCIGVDPYYLSYIAKKSGINPKIILSGREINEKMSKHYYNKITKKLFKPKAKNKILILGITFKENIDDFRNSKVVDLYNYFLKNNYNINISDPFVDKKEVKKMYNINLSKYSKKLIYNYNVIIIAVSHNIFKKINLQEINRKEFKIFDLKNITNKNIKIEKM
jgi:UDP-N-acetyl-D-glucosamine/UDP-N-acetyl-D-galactosamine dehydrogenase